jgi:hypothetical protein
MACVFSAWQYHTGPGCIPLRFTSAGGFASPPVAQARKPPGVAETPCLGAPSTRADTIHGASAPKRWVFSGVLRSINRVEHSASATNQGIRRASCRSKSGSRRNTFLPPRRGNSEGNFQQTGARVRMRCSDEAGWAPLRCPAIPEEPTIFDSYVSAVGLTAYRESAR